MSVALTAVLTATDHDTLQAAAGLVVVPLPPGDDAQVRAVLAAGRDEQGVANLLLHPHLLPADVRVPALLDGLAAPGYLRLAATVGVGQLAPHDLPSLQRLALVEALLDVVSSSQGVLAHRAAAALRALASGSDADDLVALLVHPDPTVRAELLAALLRLLGVDGLREALDEADPRAAAPARAALGAVGHPEDLARPVPVLDLVPERAAWLSDHS